jgi:hypothetical protein
MLRRVNPGIFRDRAFPDHRCDCAYHREKEITEGTNPAMVMTATAVVREERLRRMMDITRGPEEIRKMFTT